MPPPAPQGIRGRGQARGEEPLRSPVAPEVPAYSGSLVMGSVRGLEPVPTFVDGAGPLRGRVDGEGGRREGGLGSSETAREQVRRDWALHSVPVLWETAWSSSA